MERASGTPAAGASLNDVGYIVILMQENPSFDHYFSTLSGVRGFSDTGAPGGGAVFAKRGYRPGTGPDPSGYLRPFRLREDPPAQKGQSTNDISHTWTVQHQSWNNGAMDAFVTAHLADDGAANAALHRGPVQDRGAQRIGLAPPGYGRLHRDAPARAGARRGRPAAARDRDARRHQRRWPFCPRRPRRSHRCRRPVPGAGPGPHARPGDHTAAPARVSR
jgi:hypothetical protein